MKFDINSGLKVKSIMDSNAELLLKIKNYEVIQGLRSQGAGGAIAPPLFAESQFLHYKKSVFAPPLLRILGFAHPLLGSFLSPCTT